MGRSQTVPGYIVFVVVVYTPITSRAGLFSEKGWGQAGLWKVVNGKGIPSCTLYLGTGNAEQRKRESPLSSGRSLVEQRTFRPRQTQQRAKDGQMGSVAW